jgi:di/tricarboxylate transporter
MSVAIVSIILVAVIILLVSERLPVDVTAIGIMVVLMVSGILTPVEAVAGFANPAVLTIGAMLLVSRALIRSGAVGFIAQKVIHYSQGNVKVAILVVLLTVAVASAFINNTPVVVLFIPIVLSLSCEFNFSPSKFLIPVSYASILAGTCTLIGTSTNIIVSDLSAAAGFGSIGMFELSRLGVPIAVLGMVFLFFASRWLMPEHAAPTCELEDSQDKRYLAEFVVPDESKLIGRIPKEYFTDKYPGLDLFEVVHDNHSHYPDENMPLRANDLLLVKGSANDIVAIINDKLVELPHASEQAETAEFSRDALVVELIIPPQSALPGQELLETSLGRDPDINIIAMKRRRLHYTLRKIRHLILRIGDIVLIKCSRAKLDQIRKETDFIIVEDVHHQIVHKRKAPLAFLIFVAMVAAAGFGLADIMVCALSALFLMILTGCLQLKDAYKSLQADVLILIAGTIALGVAMEKTGTAALYAEYFIALFKGLSPALILAGIILLTSISTQILSNSATAVLLLPIAISTATALGVSPKPFVVAVCFGASACFASPIGYQTNLLVYGPGSYRFSDYLKLGIPLNLLVIICASVGIPYLWPF